MTETDPRRPITWVVEFHGEVPWDEFEAWAFEHKCELERLAPRGAGNVFGKDFYIVARVQMTTWDARTATLAKLMWGGRQ